MVRRLRDDGVRTVVWCTPWCNLDSSQGQIPPQAESERLHREPASNYAEGAERGHFVRAPSGEPYLNAVVDGDRLADRLLQPRGRALVARAGQANPASSGVEGIKVDDGDGFYIDDEAVLADGRSGSAGRLGSRHAAPALDPAGARRGPPRSRGAVRAQRLDRPAGGRARPGAATSHRTSGRCACSLVATLSAAASGISNWSHDIGGYLGHRLIERCRPELLIRWLQFGCFTPLMHAHSKMPQEPWNYGERTMALYRGYVLLHEQLVPYVRAAAATAARTGLPIIRPLCLTDPSDPRGWTLTDAYGYGPALWVAPVLDDGAREREVSLPRGDWIETWSGEHVRGGGETNVAGAAVPDPGLGPGGLDRRHLSGLRTWRPVWAMPTSARGRWSRPCGASRAWARPR